MSIASAKLKELLVAPNHITEADFALAVKEATKTKKEIGDILVQKALITDDQLGRLIAEAEGFRFCILREEKIDEKVLQLIPELVAKSKGVIAVSRTAKGVKIAMTDPNDVEIRHAVEKRIGERVIPCYVTSRDFRNALLLYKASLADEFKEELGKLQDQSLPREKRDEAAMQIVDTILQYGYQNKASDIHIEPYAKKIVVRFRVDGMMHDVLEIPKQLADLIITRVKILSRMRTDEHRAAQDGKFRYEAPDEMVDIRVSVVPVTQGENVVMRLLSSQNRRFDLPGIGLSEGHLKKVRTAIKNPHGMILVTGPTGSGKTTTLYAVLKILNKKEVHVATIEDPVEYDIEGVSQIQVNTATNLTFAKGLRAIVRQDPDIIMVGEIRDEETAGIAVNSAMTGHLVLSTLHANDAATTLPRLLDMGLEPFLIASTVNVVIAQRLVRTIHAKCRVSYTPTKSDVKLLSGLAKNTRVYKGAGCKVCNNTGYSGRIGIFEVLLMTEGIKNLILARASSDDIMKTARADGMTTMAEDGLEKVKSGTTTVEEVLRVAKT
jgi:type IV pilus assembly protein PilB